MLRKVCANTVCAKFNEYCTIILYLKCSNFQILFVQLPFCSQSSFSFRIPPNPTRHPNTRYLSILFSKQQVPVFLVNKLATKLTQHTSPSHCVYSFRLTLLSHNTSASAGMYFCVVLILDFSSSVLSFSTLFYSYPSVVNMFFANRHHQHHESHVCETIYVASHKWNEWSRLTWNLYSETGFVFVVIRIRLSDCLRWIDRAECSWKQHVMSCL